MRVTVISVSVLADVGYLQQLPRFPAGRERMGHGGDTPETHLQLIEASRHHRGSAGRGEHQRVGNHSDLFDTLRGALKGIAVKS